MCQWAFCISVINIQCNVQELLLILDEYWKSNPDLHDVPIYYASKMASKALRVYQTFVNMMNSHIQSLMDVKNPFHFNHISSLKGADSSMQLLAPCVVMAAPGMLQNGESRRLFEDWCDDPTNGVVLAGYSVEGTLAKKLLSDPEEITCLNGRIKKCQCSIEYISFSAHVDYLQNSEFIRTVVPDNIVLVHGEKTEMGRLKGSLEREIQQSWPDASHTPPVVMPENGQTVTLTFDNPILADVVGTVATSLLNNISTKIDSANENDEKSVTVEVPENVVLVTENFQSKVMATSELSTYSSCRVGQIEQLMVVPLPQDVIQLKKHNNVNVIHMLVPHLQEVFDDVHETEDIDEKNTSNVQNTKVIIQDEIMMKEVDGGSTSSRHENCVIVTWLASPSNDLIADCATGLLFQVLSTTHFLRTCWLEAHKVKDINLSGTKRPTQNGKEVNITTPSESCIPTDDEAVVKRMKMGLLDPSRSFSNDNKVDGIIYEDMDPVVIAKNRPKLEKIRSYLSQYKDTTFESVTLSRNGLRLIIRAHDTDTSVDGVVEGGDDEESTIISEAYCYIHWAEKENLFNCKGNASSMKKCNMHSHESSATKCHAVVQSRSNWLRGEIVRALSQIEGDL